MIASDSHQMKRLNYDTLGGKAILMFIEEVVEVDTWSRREG